MTSLMTLGDLEKSFSYCQSIAGQNVEN